MMRSGRSLGGAGPSGAPLVLDMQGRLGNRAIAALLGPGPSEERQLAPAPAAPSATLQRKIGFEYELDSIRTRHTDSYALNPMKTWVQHHAGERILKRDGYDITADIGTGYSRLEFVTDAFDEETELDDLLDVIDSIIADIAAIKNASLAHEQRGYGAGRFWGGAQGWLATDRWVGLDQIPRLGGSWRQQLEFAAHPNSQLVGQLQMTAGFNLEGLQRLVSGDQLGDVTKWGKGWNADERQYVTAYARTDKSSKLYRRSLKAVRSNDLTGDRRDDHTMAAIITVMAQAPIAYRGAPSDAGQMIAKTDYARILQLAAEDGIHFTPDALLATLLDVVNETVNGRVPLTPDDSVFVGDAALNLGRVSFREWIGALVPTPRAQRLGVRPRDLMTRRHYPGTRTEKIAMRTYGPYGSRTDDPGDRAIFELRELMKNPVTDLRPLVEALADLMVAINR